MLERIREGSQGVAAKTVLGLVILTFAISGIGSYINSQADAAVAKVNGVEISKSTLEQAFQSERSRMQSQFGDVVQQLFSDENYLNNMRQNILDRLVVEELQKQQAADLGIRVGDAQIRDQIVNMPQFQQNGTFNNDIYLASIRQAGFQPNQFREYLREQMARGQFAGSIMGSEFVLPAEENAFQQLNDQVRSFDLVTIDAKLLQADVEVSDEELETFYQENSMNYQTQEQVALEYIVVDSVKLGESIEVTEQELETYYNDNIVDYTQAERRRIAHILLESDEAKAKAGEIQEKLNAGETFADLVATYSEDTFSAENGGDLEYFETGLFGEEFDAAVMTLENVGDVTEAVEVEAGIHFIALTEIQPEQVQPFSEVKASIEAALKEDKITELYVEAQTKVNEVAFEVPDNLQEAANESGLTLQTLPLSSRFQLPAPVANPLVVSKIFDPDFIAEGLNSELIDLNDTSSIVVRVTEHEPARQQTLDEVKVAVTAAVKKQKAEALAKSKADELLAKLNEGAELAAAVAEFNAESERVDQLTRTDTRVDRVVRDNVFSMSKPASDSKVQEVVVAANGNATVVVLDKVEVKAPAEESNSTSQVAQVVNQQASKALIAASRLNAEIE